MIFFFNDTATPEIYTLSLHDALPIFGAPHIGPGPISCEVRGHKLRPYSTPSRPRSRPSNRSCHTYRRRDRKSTRLNSSHANISYAVFCLKKKQISSGLHRLVLLLYSL